MSRHLEILSIATEGLKEARERLQQLCAMREKQLAIATEANFRADDYTGKIADIGEDIRALLSAKTLMEKHLGTNEGHTVST